MPKVTRIAWTPQMHKLLRKLWYAGVPSHIIAQQLQPYIGHLCTAHAVITQAGRIKARRSQAALSAIRQKARLGYNTPYTEEQEPTIPADRPKPLVLPKPYVRHLPHIPYLGLATLGPDPFRQQRIIQAINGSKGRL